VLVHTIEVPNHGENEPDVRFNFDRGLDLQISTERDWISRRECFDFVNANFFW
jgi:hypothetical protein